MIMLTRKNDSYLLNVVGRDFGEQQLGMSFKEGHWTIEGEANAVLISQQRREILDLLRSADDSMQLKDIAETLDKRKVLLARCSAN